MSSESASLSEKWAPAWTPPAGEVAHTGVGAADRAEALGSARGAARAGAGSASGIAAEEAVSTIWSRRRQSSPSSCCISAMSSRDSVLSAAVSGRCPVDRRDPRAVRPWRPVRVPIWAALPSVRGEAPRRRSARAAAQAETVSSASVVSTSVVSASARRRAADDVAGSCPAKSRRRGGAKAQLRRLGSRGVFAGPPGPRWEAVPVGLRSEATARSVAARCAWSGSKGDVPCTVATEPPPAVDAAGLFRPRAMRSGKDGNPPRRSARAPAAAATSPLLTTARGAPPAADEEEEEEATRSMAPGAATHALTRSSNEPVQPRDQGRGSCDRAWNNGVTRCAKCSTTPIREEGPPIVQDKRHGLLAGDDDAFHRRRPSS